MQAKVAVAVVSLILLVGAIVGIVVIISSNNGNDEQSNVGIVTGMKAAETLCAPTDYKDLCTSTLSPVAKTNARVTPKDLVEVAFEATLEEVQKALTKTISLGKDLTNSTIDKMSMNDCQEHLKHASYELEMAISKVADSEMHKMGDLLAELNNWLSAVVAYKASCLDDIVNPELQISMQDGLMNTTHLTYNALGIVNEFSKILSKINVTIPSLEQNHKARRLLNTEIDKDGYPTWFSAADHKLFASHNQVRPNAVVAQDGSGQFKSINDAIAAYRTNPGGRYIIHVKAGIYREKVIVPFHAINVYMYGDSPRKTIVTGRKSRKDNIDTVQTATFTAIGAGFIAKSMGFRNTAGPEGEQALALRVESDMAAFYNCRMDGYQDTLYTHIIVKKPLAGQLNIITANGKEHPECNSGIVLQHCRITSEFGNPPQIKSYLGRPWKRYSRTMIMQTYIEKFIDPEGWTPWNKTSTHHHTCEYKEYANHGPGADTSRRVRWSSLELVTDRKVAEKFTAVPFLQANMWLKNTGVPVTWGL
ncbi:hypothetical protein AQUCO_02900053v1 [Aquilegia coerulea]|uniref:Pectinesterase n=1 Tax=Aquilegia coerulea TaxID=218851 RepID=A0A2G5D338_AQUCA|nr:hypothetical protein AQUCO_02900053v1 [Aquilegia coerulea]